MIKTSMETLGFYFFNPFFFTSEAPHYTICYNETIGIGEAKNTVEFPTNIVKKC